MDSYSRVATSSNVALLPRIAFALVSAGLLAGCATPRAALPQGTFPLASSLPVELYIAQQELEVDAQQTDPMAAGGGLLGALVVMVVDNSAAKKDQARMGPIRDELVDLDMRETITTALKAGLDTRRLATEVVFEVFPESPTERLSRGALGSRRNVLTIQARYALGYDMQTLAVSLDASYGDREMDSKRNKSAPVRICRVAHIVPWPGDSRGLKESGFAINWAELSGPAWAALLSSAIEDAVAMLDYDLHVDPALERGPQTQFRYGAQASGRGKIVRDVGDRQWVREGSDRLVSLPKQVDTPPSRSDARR